MQSAFPHSLALILAPHTDDAELGCGGSMARIMSEGVEVHVASFSIAQTSLPPGADPHLLEKEFKASMKVFGVPTTHSHVLNFPVRLFHEYRQPILDEMLKLRKLIQPDCVFITTSDDCHQDHQIIYSEALRAFKDITVWGYELPWNNRTFDAQGFITLDENHLRKKWEALQQYQSQIKLARPYFSWEFIQGLGKVRGVQVKAPYAEAFEIIRQRY
jgi:LmbE family N-acetylglucosaminyl deacetylase